METINRMQFAMVCCVFNLGAVFTTIGVIVMLMTQHIPTNLTLVKETMAFLQAHYKIAVLVGGMMTLCGSNIFFGGTMYIMYYANQQSTNPQIIELKEVI